jgi:hypothetical protein
MGALLGVVESIKGVVASIRRRSAVRRSKTECRDRTMPDAVERLSR